MADIKLMVKMPEEVYDHILKAKSTPDVLGIDIVNAINAVKNGISLTSDVLAALLMEERIRGELKQDISYSKDIIDDVRCRLTVNIIDHRPCYCGAELREVWRERE